MPVPPTFPMLVGGRLRRAAAGRGRAVTDGDAVTGFATEASAADVAEAVAAARAALPGWSGLPVDERGRVLFAVAELLDGHPDLAGAADRWLWYAGWADKLPFGAARTAADGASWSVPRPVGVVGVVAAPSPAGLVEALAPALAAGATAVVVAPRADPRAAGSLAEVLAGSELPAGAANVLTGDPGVLGPALARAGVDGFDPGDRFGDDPGTARLRAWTTTATVWHPAGR